MMIDETSVEHPKRDQLYTAITKEPGITFQELKNKVDYSVSTLQYHLKVLQKNRLIRKEMERGERTYYSFETRTNRTSLRIGFELNDTQRRILLLISEEPDISQTGLSSNLNINRFNLFYHLKVLLDNGYISRRKEGRIVHYNIVDEKELKKRMLLRLIDELLLGKIDEATYQRLKRLI
jgi:predicted transcriptional regulator